MLNLSAAPRRAQCKGCSRWIQIKPYSYMKWSILPLALMLLSLLFIYVNLFFVLIAWVLIRMAWFFLSPRIVRMEVLGKPAAGIENGAT